MSRRMSFNETKTQMYARVKTVTRRDPDTNQHHQPGDIVVAVEKLQGIPRGGRQVVITSICIASNRVETLGDLTQAEVDAEGFPEFTVLEFAAFWARLNGWRQLPTVASGSVWLHPKKGLSTLNLIECRRIEFSFEAGSDSKPVKL